MSPGKHLLSGIVLGTSFYVRFKRVGTAVAAATAAVLCDFDHVLEYGVYCMKNDTKPNAGQFFSGSYFEKKGTIFILFHAYEYLLFLFLLLLFAAKRAWKIKGYIGAIFAGYALHLALDTIGNDCTFKGYFIGYRARQRWALKKICDCGSNELERKVK